jgi:geranylgeranyl transferase type-1 subunit beta
MVSDDQAAELAQPSHIRYALRHLRMLPPPYQSDDSNRITFAFFALGSLAILGGLDRLDLAERTDYISWIYRRWNPEIGGFGGAPNIDLRVMILYP